MEGLEVTVLLGVSVLVGMVIAPRLRIATPLVLLIIGLLLGFVPALREIQLPPETVLLLFLPVLLFWESLTTSLRSIRRDFRFILPMSTLLVVASAFAVAWVATLMGMSWSAALILGAAVAPPDATAVAALGRMLPRRTFMKLKAESLTNDGTALVIYAIAVSLAVGEQVTPLTVTWTVLLSYVGGITIGIAVAGAAYLVLQRMRDTMGINVALILVPFAAYLVAELIHASGVLAVVVAGLIVAWVLPRITTAASRRQAESFWPLVVLLLNGALFVLIGLEVQYVVRAIPAAEIGWLLLVTVAAWVVSIAVRYLFQLISVPFFAIGGTRLPRGPLRHRARMVSAMAGFRGAVSLAIALSVPITLPSGASMPGRDEVVFVTAGVIVLSLLVQGPLLPAIVRWARFPQDNAEDEEFELAVRSIGGAALASLDDLAAEHGISDAVRDRVRSDGYEMLELANARAAARERSLVDEEIAELDRGIDEPDPLATLDGVQPALLEGQTDGGLQMLAQSSAVDVLQESPIIRYDERERLKLAMLDRKREVLLRLRREGTVDDIIVRRIQARLDLEEVRLRGLEEFD